MPSNQDTIPRSWVSGIEAKSGSLATDGGDITSYGHVIGTTSIEGKIAYDCHYSVTTSRHSNDAKRVADVVLSSCPSCGWTQPDVVEDMVAQVTGRRRRR